MKQASIFTGNVCVEKYYEPKINKIHIDTVVASKHLMEFDKINTPQKYWDSVRASRMYELRPAIITEDFEIIKFLGRGGFSIVNLVKWKHDGKEYALKIMSKTEVARNRKINTLMREKNIMNMLDHPNIARLENAFQDSSSLYFVLEYYQLGNLSDMIKESNTLDLNLTKNFIREIIDALEYLRLHNIVHRDIKPDNILIDDQYHAKISDFGSAKIIDPDEVEEELIWMDQVETGWDSNNEISMRYSEGFEKEEGFEKDEDFESILNRKNTFVGTPFMCLLKC